MWASQTAPVVPFTFIPWLCDWGLSTSLGYSSYITAVEECKCGRCKWPSHQHLQYEQNNGPIKQMSP